MEFHTIDFEHWDRKECFEHFMNNAKSSYSLTVNVDITKLHSLLKSKGYRLYPVFTWIVARAINNHTEFKMGYNQQGQLGFFDEVSPCYSVLNEKTKIMDSLLTPFNKEFSLFYHQMVFDMEQYKLGNYIPQPMENFFLVSCLPWLTYSSFNVTNQCEQQFLFPMVTWGKFFEQGNTILMPLTLQVHHAVVDGYHCSLFYQDIEEVLNNPALWIQ